MRVNADAASAWAKKSPGFSPGRVGTWKGWLDLGVARLPAGHVVGECGRGFEKCRQVRLARERRRCNEIRSYAAPDRSWLEAADEGMNIGRSGAMRRLVELGLK